MTRQEMLKRFRELGGVSIYNACLITIEKYQELSQEWKSLTEPIVEDDYPRGDNCALCHACGRKEERLPDGRIHTDIPDCTKCPIADCTEDYEEDDCHDPDCSCHCPTPYARVLFGIEEADFLIFDSGCNDIIEICKEALPKASKDITHELCSDQEPG